MTETYSFSNQLRAFFKKPVQEIWVPENIKMLQKRLETKKKRRYITVEEQAKLLFFRLQNSTNSNIKKLYHEYISLCNKIVLESDDFILNLLLENYNSLSNLPIEISSCFEEHKQYKDEWITICKSIYSIKDEIMKEKFTKELEYGMKEFKPIEFPIKSTPLEINFTDEDLKGIFEPPPNSIFAIPKSQPAKEGKINDNNILVIQKKKRPKSENPFATIINSNFKDRESSAEIIFKVLKILCSKQSPESVTNEFVDLLGLDALELISKLNEKRDEIKNLCEPSLNDLGSNINSAQICSFLSKLGIKNSLSYYKVQNDINPDEKASNMLANTDENKMQQSKDFVKYSYCTDKTKKPPNVKLIHTKIMPEWCHQAFSETPELNPIQSVVFDTAFKTSKNMLVCAPTGAGKTNVALLAVLKEIEPYLKLGSLKGQKFTIIYITPMKALASEITAKFASKLSYLKFNVKELTGDIHISKQEMANSHMLVATPEKLDVVSRNSEELFSRTKLLIIDEIHLLNEDRGPVLECLVVRAFTHITRYQTPLRIIGLSATLPNFKDIGTFIRASPDAIFYFDNEFRPTPLDYEFYGVLESSNTLRKNNIMNQICYDIALKIVKMGKQLLIFVHSRADTYKVAKGLIDIIKDKNSAAYFESENMNKMAREVNKSKSKEIVDLYKYSVSIHHAGLLRKDRNLVEALFKSSCIKVLVTTSTLAWGVNLPAYGVVIRGTEFYDPSKGNYVDIDNLDIQQIFGRAGRPQFDSQGEAAIITQFDKLDPFINKIKCNLQIESKFQSILEDALNAEISIGNLSSVFEAMDWIKGTYLYQRISKNPKHYNISTKEIEHDPLFEGILRHMIEEAALTLNDSELIDYSTMSETFTPTTIGKIASKYYIKHQTITGFVKEMKKYPNMVEGELLQMLSDSSEFRQLEARKEQFQELKILRDIMKICELDLDQELTQSGKVLILIEAYLSDVFLAEPSLVSDRNYIMQNAPRILRAIYELAIHLQNLNVALISLTWAIRLEKKISPEETHLKQFSEESFNNAHTNAGMEHVTGCITKEKMMRLMERNITAQTFYQNDKMEMVKLIGGEYNYEYFRSFVRHFPRLDISYTINPVTTFLFKAIITIKPDFNWSPKWNGNSEIFRVLVDYNGLIEYEDSLLISESDMDKMKKQLEVGFFLRFPEHEELQEYYVCFVSEKWLGCTFSVIINVEDIPRPNDEIILTS